MPSVNIMYIITNQFKTMKNLEVLNFMIKSNLNMMALFEINAKKKIEQTELHK